MSTTMSKPVLIAAGEHKLAEMLVDKLNITNWKYIKDERDLMGYSNCVIILTGRWYIIRDIAWRSIANINNHKILQIDLDELVK